METKRKWPFGNVSSAWLVVVTASQPTRTRSCIQPRNGTLLKSFVDVLFSCVCVCVCVCVTRVLAISYSVDRWTRDRKVAGSSSRRSGGRIFFTRVNFLCLFLFRYPFHPRVTTVAPKRSRSFCPKCRWQVTAKYTCTYLCGFE